MLKTYIRNRSKKGLIRLMFNNQRWNCIKRGDSPPKYTRKELEEWMFSQEEYHKLYNEWVLSEYDRYLIPSIDRINDYKTFSFENIKISTWGQNKKRGCKDRREGRNNKTNKAVVMLTKNNEFIREFHSLHQAERETKIFYQNISAACSGITKTAGGYKWDFK